MESQERRLIRVPGERLGHIPSFDGLRGLFVLQVVLYHAEVTDFLGGTPIIIDWFFVASGFLITTLLLDEQSKAGDLNLRNFYTRRVLRLFPAMYAMIAVFSLMLITLNLINPTPDSSLWWVESLGAALYVYFLVAAFFPGTIGLIGHTWSLTVEEQFYFFWPPLLRRTLRRATRRADLHLIIGCLVFIAVFVFLRMRLQFVIEGGTGAEPKFYDEGAITWQGVVYRIVSVRPDMIVYGCLIAFVARRIPRPVPAHIRKWLAVGGYVGWFVFVLTLFVTKPGPPGFAALFGGPLYQVALFLIGPIVLDGYFRQESWYSKVFSVGAARYLGQRSYGIYLWHIPVLLPFLPFITTHYGLPKLAVGLVASGLGICAGLLSYRYIERRFLHIKDTRFAKKFEQTP
ncbi:MAG: acyltransferase family protein [Microthrixaceae bacterium]